MVVSLHVLPPAVFAIVHGSLLYRLKGVLFFAFTCLGVAVIAEGLSLRTGFPFGHYHFTEVMGPKLFGLPLLLALAYSGTAPGMLGILILGIRGKPIAGYRVFDLSGSELHPAHMGFIHGTRLVHHRSRVDMARWRTVFWRSIAQLLRKVLDRLSVLPGVCSLLQGTRCSIDFPFVPLLAYTDLDVWNLCRGQSFASEIADGATNRERRDRGRMDNDE